MSGPSAVRGILAGSGGASAAGRLRSPLVRKDTSNEAATQAARVTSHNAESEGACRSSVKAPVVASVAGAPPVSQNSGAFSLRMLLFCTGRLGPIERTLEAARPRFGWGWRRFLMGASMHVCMYVRMYVCVRIFCFGT